MPTRPPQVRVPTSLPMPALRKYQGMASPPEPEFWLMSMTLGPKMAPTGSWIGLPSRSMAPESGEALEHVDHVVGDEAALVAALVEHQRLLVELRVEVAVEVGVARAAGVGHVDIGHLAAGEFVDLAAVGFNPVQVAQAVFVVDGDDGHVAGVFAVGVGADVQHGLLAGGAVEELRRGCRWRAVRGH